MEWAGALVITAIAGFLRMWQLGRPHSFEFDETYYAKDAWSMLHFGYARDYVDKANDQILAGHTLHQWTSTPEMFVHPPLGKWIIALGEQTFGMTPFGWRISSAVIGTLMVLVMIRFTRRVTGSNLLGLVAGILMCCDGMQLVLSRLALLDIYVAFFILCAVHCMVADRDWGRDKMPEAYANLGPRPVDWGPPMWWRPWRLAAGVMWGCALACKWDALFALAGMCLLMWVWDTGARRKLGIRGAWWKAAFLDEFPALGYLVLLPLLIYVASWTGWLMHHQIYEANLSNTQYGPYWGDYIKHKPHGFFGQAVQALRSMWHYHHDVYNFHTKFLNTAHHTYQSDPQGWLILNRPVGIDAQLGIQPGAQGCSAPTGDTCLRQVLLLGTPALWWFSTVALIAAAITWITRRDWRYGLVIVPVAVLWLPWFRYDDRPIFSYYAITFEPFLILGAVLLLGMILGPRDASAVRRRNGAIAAGVIVFAVVANFAYFWPIYTDGLLTNSEWLHRIWFKRWI